MKTFDPQTLKTGMLVVEATVTGEIAFITEVQTAAITHLRARPGKAEAEFSKDDFPTLGSAQGHKHVIALAQFYFFLHALDCTSGAQVASLLRGHNARLDSAMTSDSPASKRELEKAQFKERRINQVVETITYYNSQVFSVSELASLLIHVMAPKTTETLVTDLLHGGLMVQRGIGQEDVPPNTDPRRVLVEPTEMFLDAYVRSQILTYDRIISGTAGGA